MSLWHRQIVKKEIILHNCIIFSLISLLVTFIISLINKQKKYKCITLKAVLNHTYCVGPTEEAQRR